MLRKLLTFLFFLVVAPVFSLIEASWVPSSSRLFDFAESDHWTCPKCGHLNKKPYPRHKCARCSWPYD